MEDIRKRNIQVNFACPVDMAKALDVLKRELRLDGRPAVVRYLLVDAINSKFKELGFEGLVSETDRPEEKKS